MGVKQKNFDENKTNNLGMRRPMSGMVMKSERKRNISTTENTLNKIFSSTTKKMTTDNDISELVKLMIVMTVDSMDNGIEMMDYDFICIYFIFLLHSFD